MPVLPIIDLLILLGWTTIASGAVLKAVYVTTSYRPTLLGLTPIDLLMVSAMFLGLALTLAARQWVKANEPKMAARRREANSREPHSPYVDASNGEAVGAEPAGTTVGASTS